MKYVIDFKWICDPWFKILYGCSYHLVVQRAFVYFSYMKLTLVYACVKFKLIMCN
jgi:hypothetical protein